MRHPSRARGRRLGVLLGLVSLTATPLALLLPSMPASATTTSTTSSGTDPSGSLWTSTEASVDVASYPATHTLQLPQFDTTLGTLTEVDLDGWVSGTVDGTLKNLSTSLVKDLAPYVDANISVHGPLVGTTANAHASTPLELQPQQTLGYHLTNRGDFHAMSQDASVLAGFIGTSTVDYPVDTDVTTGIQGPAPYDWYGVAQGAAAVKVTYHYLPPQPLTQTESIQVHVCNNGAPTSYDVPGATVGDTTQPIPTTGAPLDDAQVSAGSHDTYAHVGDGWQLVACGASGVVISGDHDATQTISVPPGGSATAIYYAQQVPTTCTSGCATGAQTAWASGLPSNGGRYNPDGGGSWATYVGGPTGTWNVYAGQTTYAGTVSIDAAGHVSVNLSNGARFQQGGANLQIQGYDAPPSGNPAPGQFANQITCSGTTCTGTVPTAKYYGIHLGVVLSGSNAAMAPASTTTSTTTSATASATTSTTASRPSGRVTRRAHAHKARHGRPAAHATRHQGKGQAR